jgi:hypothetical protein
MLSAMPIFCLQAIAPVPTNFFHCMYCKPFSKQANIGEKGHRVELGQYAETVIEGTERVAEWPFDLTQHPWDQPRIQVIPQQGSCVSSSACDFGCGAVWFSPCRAAKHRSVDNEMPRIASCRSNHRSYQNRLISHERQELMTECDSGDSDNLGKTCLRFRKMPSIYNTVTFHDA